MNSYGQPLALTAITDLRSLKAVILALRARGENIKLVGLPEGVYWKVVDELKEFKNPYPKSLYFGETLIIRNLDMPEPKCPCTSCKEARNDPAAHYAGYNGPQIT